MALGIHQSFENPLVACVETAEKIGADTFQIFIRNNRNMKRRVISRQEIDYFNRGYLNSGIQSFVVHAPYAMNLCTDDKDKRERYLSIVKEDLKIMNTLAGTKYYVIHPGSFKDLDITSALRNIQSFLFELKDYIGTVNIALEFMAGAGTQVLSTPEQIYFIKIITYDIPNICICFDTCHVYGAGYNVMQTYNQLRQYIGVIHLNNSQAAFGSKRDRHANILEGLIPVEELLAVAHDFQDRCPYSPIVLETPVVNLVEDFYYVKEKIK